MNYEEVWFELKNRMKSQHLQASKINSDAGGILAHVYKDVGDHMWSLEKKIKKEEDCQGLSEDD